jgi:hypothetical protein
MKRKTHEQFVDEVNKLFGNTVGAKQTKQSRTMKLKIIIAKNIIYRF